MCYLGQILSLVASGALISQPPLFPNRPRGNEWPFPGWGEGKTEAGEGIHMNLGAQVALRSLRSHRGSTPCVYFQSPQRHAHYMYFQSPQRHAHRMCIFRVPRGMHTACVFSEPVCNYLSVFLSLTHLFFKEIDFSHGSFIVFFSN